MTRLLLVALNARYSHANPALFYLRESLRDLPVEVLLRQWTIQEPPLTLLARFRELQPDVIGLSVAIWNTTLIRTILPDLRKILPKTRIVLGGPETWADPESWLGEHGADYVIPGAGEAGLRTLAETGFTWPEQVVRVPAIPFDRIPFPYRDSDFVPPNDPTDDDPGLSRRYVYYEASRGCPFHCTYCLSGDTKIERRPLGVVRDELDFLIARKPPLVKFVDRTFNADPEFARAIWRHLIDAPCQTKFHFEIHPALLTDTDFELLGQAPAGRFQFEAGVQAIQPRILAEIRRHELWETVRENLSRLAALRQIHLHVDMIVGLREQTHSDAMETFDALSSIGADCLQIGFLKALPGTPVAADSDLVASRTPPYPVLLTKWMTFCEIDAWRNLAELHDHYANSGLFRTTLRVALGRAPSHYGFWKAFDAYHAARRLRRDNQTWTVLAQRLQDFLHELGDTDLVDDCLRWDWCGIAARHSYPPFLDYPGSKKLRDEARGRFPDAVLARTPLFLARFPQFPDITGLPAGLVAFPPGSEPVILE
jgi:radical SAM superfamily enzyme YgiQ (UPF0313 family)